MNITHQTVIGEDGRPEAAIIPWNVFLEIQKLMDDAKVEKDKIKVSLIRILYIILIV